LTKIIFKGQSGQAASADASIEDPNATVTPTGEQERSGTMRKPIDH